jgi:hypothetical protein
VTSSFTPAAYPESLGGGRQDEVGILERRKADEHDAVGEAVEQPGGGLDGEPCLARPASAGQGDQPDIGTPEQVCHVLDLALATDERRRLTRQARPRRGDAPLPRGRELGVVVQDLSLETLQCGAGIDPELVDEPRAGLLEGLQRVCLPPGAIEREHELSAHTLAKRVSDDEALEHGDDLRVPAELELDIDLLLDHRESELFEPHSLRGRELLIAKVRQRVAAEECERLPQLPRPCGWTIRSRRGDDSLEAVSVQLIAPRKRSRYPGGRVSIRSAPSRFRRAEM